MCLCPANTSSTVMPVRPAMPTAGQPVRPAMLTAGPPSTRQCLQWDRRSPGNAHSGSAGPPGNAHRRTADLFARSDWTATLRRRKWPFLSAKSVRWPPVTSLNARTLLLWEHCCCLSIDFLCRQTQSTLSKPSSRSTAVVSPLTFFADRPSPTSIYPSPLPRLITPALLLPL